jgi:L-iditol 2-dehydrogenase
MSGAFQEFLVADEKQLVILPNSMSFDDGALLEPMGVAYHAVALSRIQKNETLAIFGAGAIGLLTLALAKRHHAGTVFIVDNVAGRLAFAAKNYNADHCIIPKDTNPIDYIREHTKGRGVDISIEAAGTAQTFEWAFEAARIGGRVTLIGIPAEDRISFNAHSLRRRELLVQNVRRSNQTLEPCIKLVESGALSLQGLATHHFKLDNIATAFDVASGYKDGVIRAMITS